jgi:ParB-like chromosome segregation protein Spo0J
MQRKNELQVEFRPVSEITPYEGNPRVIPQSAVEKVAASIRQFGWQQPIVVDMDGVIVAGHTRRLAALHLGLKSIPVHVADGLTADQIAAYRLADNRVADETRWDMNALADELRNLSTSGIDLLDLGFDPIELPTLDPTVTEVDAGEVLPLDKVAARTCPHCGGALT